MIYLAFEAGSRAGYSAELFFRHYIKMTGSNDMLYLSDRDKAYSLIENWCKDQVVRTCDILLPSLIDMRRSDISVFPCDELTRQTNQVYRKIAERNWYSKVARAYYDKMFINRLLSDKDLPIRIPKTFTSDNVCIRPNTQSAGSKGVMFLPNYCVTELIDIEEEYVVDCFKKGNELYVYPRAVTLKNGYDRFIKFIGEDSPLTRKVAEFIEKVSFQFPSFDLFDGIFHLQLAKDKSGEYWYIESSKRISGTSIVNLPRGYNPFMLINGHEFKPKCMFECDKWYRFEDILYEIHRYVENS